MLLHDREELDDDLGGRTDQNLALAGLLGVVDGIEAVVEHGSLDHFGGIVVLRFSGRCVRLEVSTREEDGMLAFKSHHQKHKGAQQDAREAHQ